MLSGAVASLLLLTSPSASSSSSSSNLRSIAEHDRRLSYELIANYEPKFQVTDHNAIDLDQLEIEDQVNIGTVSSFDKARRVYEEGGHSKSVAMVKLTTPLTSALAKSTAVSGKAAAGFPVYGKVYHDYPNGESTIEVQYKTIDQQSAYVGCQVGGISKPNLDGCFAPSGALSIDGVSMEYSYDPKSQNVNKRTIQKFSLSAEERMFRCGPTCPYDTFRKFREYYGFFDYADKWIDAAFEGTATAFDRGNANFARFDFKGRAEAIKKATAYMSIWMYVIREMENALDECQADCKKTGCNDDTIRAWDEAVAYYTGSLEGSTGAGSGKLMYALADKRCQEFRTCGDMAESAQGTSHVNGEVIRSFALGSRMLSQAKCTEARQYKERIEVMMTVPLIQGTLRYAYFIWENPNVGQKADAEGATFAAAILPVVHACDEDAADTIFRNMKTGEESGVVFQEVKQAFESVYECMGVRHADVGGLWDADAGDYFPGAKPSSVSSSSGNVNIPLLIGCTAGGLVAGIIIYMFISKCCCSNAAPIETKEDPMAEDADETPSAEEDALPSIDSQCEPVEIS